MAAEPGRESPNVPMRVSRDQLEKVIHRAAELQFGRGETPEVLEAEEVLRIAEEVGLEGRFVRQALAEVRADALLPARPVDDSVPTRLWGEAILVAARVVPGEPLAIQDRLARYLADRESLRCVRDRPGQLVFEPAKDFMSQLQRGLDFGGRGYELAKARSLGVMIQSLEEGRSLVSITADMSNQRWGHAAGWYGSLGTFGLGSALGAILGGGLPALIVIPAVASGVGLVATVGTSKTVGVQRHRLELAVQGLLDRLERGFTMASDRPTLRERITDLLEE
ncbi:MAG: hypothetical protein M8843_06635 [marine benthic group bacterium]|nr:hypothetical protein [Gemmatimonadota bacterium]